jgi:hypothetical protein
VGGGQFFFGLLRRECFQKSVHRAHALLLYLSYYRGIVVVLRVITTRTAEQLSSKKGFKYFTSTFTNTKNDYLTTLKTGTAPRQKWVFVTFT